MYDSFKTTKMLVGMAFVVCGAIMLLALVEDYLDS